MEGFLVTAATGALKSVLVKIAAMAGDTRSNGVRGQISFLADELAAMHAFLLRMSDSEEGNADPQDKAWMREVRELSYDIEDSLDEFMLHLDGESANPDGFIDKFRNLLAKIVARHRIPKMIGEFKAQIKQVGERNARYRSNGGISLRTANATVDQRALTIFQDVSSLVGVDQPKKEFIDLLMKDDGHVASEHLRIISIVGIGGLGKTTIANLVFEELREQFDCSAFVSVSRNPDISGILRIILSEVSAEPYGNTESGDVQQLIRKITTFLKNKRYLIVIDDLWNIESWKIIKCAFSRSITGNRIITTTRINEVAKSCCFPHVHRVYKLRPLHFVDSKRLFLKRIFGLEECPSHLTEVCCNILAKCDGLPLATIAISGLLATKAPTEDQWNQVEKSIGYALERNEDVNGMIRILSLSYFDLPHNLRTCLLYLCTFPEDYIIHKKRLVRRWIAEGFIHEEHGHTLYELGQRCFNELINRSLIEPRYIGKFGEVKSCRVHDTILDFIRSKSIEENFVTLLGIPNVPIDRQKKVQRLSLLVNTEEYYSSLEENNIKYVLDKKEDDSNEQEDNSNGFHILKKLNLCNARLLTIFPHSVKVPSLLQFRRLRVLDFEGCEQLENHHLANIENLLHLKYLSIKDTIVNVLPTQIIRLRYLQTLNVDVRGAINIPTHIYRLRQLTYLLVDMRCQLPAKIGNMQALQELKVVNVLAQSLNTLQGLGKLTNLRKLSIFMPGHHADAAERYKGHMKAMISSICKLGRDNLHCLTIHISSVSADDFIQEPWCPPPLSLQELVINQAPMSRVPRWIGSLVNLQRLGLYLKELSQEDVSTLGGLPALLSLILYVEEVITEEGGRLRISSSYGFPSLERIRLGGESCRLELTFEVGCLPKLQQLNLECMVAEENHTSSSNVVFGIEHLSRLTSIYCCIHYKYETRLAKVAMLAALERSIISHPNQPTFTKEEYGDFVDEFC
ncbi:disease resistance protein RGA5-like [Oryza glaberrima]|nr:disease resistance protein RGA5-like [Oryza glaberrima]XP_052164550.1 disease resistance protein RGA5-like [Oryza glaberrima]XP_052164551.1 disease resistance protein RGA5-like [Oryza glaberrima]XP_052164552.1 disease resistance protein RGA5-like [Oryza glaberrima]